MHEADQATAEPADLCHGEEVAGELRRFKKRPGRCTDWGLDDDPGWLVDGWLTPIGVLAGIPCPDCGNVWVWQEEEAGIDTKLRCHNSTCAWEARRRPAGVQVRYDIYDCDGVEDG